MNPFPHQSVQVGRVHVIEPQRANRVVALLVRDDKDDIGLVHAEAFESRCDSKAIFSGSFHLSSPWLPQIDHCQSQPFHPRVPRAR